MTIPPSLSGGYQLWYYYPSVPGGIAVASIFGILVSGQLFGLIKTGKKFCIPLVIGGICKFNQSNPPPSIDADTDNVFQTLVEVVGYGARVVAHYHITSTILYAIQSLLILLAPILFAASVYMYLKRIIFDVRGEGYCIVPARHLTKIFVTGDVLCFVVQGAGGGILAGAKNHSQENLGENVILTGLILQIVIFAFFIIVAAMFLLRMKSSAWKTRREQAAAAVAILPWQRLLTSLYVMSFLIILRNTVRAVEYAMGSSGYLLRHEWITFVFDGACMILVLLISLSWYRGNVAAKYWTNLESHQLRQPQEK